MTTAKKQIPNRKVPTYVGKAKNDNVERRTKDIDPPKEIILEPFVPRNSIYDKKAIKETGLATTNTVNGLAMKFDDALAKGKVLIADGLQQLTATVAMRDLTPIQLREVFDYSAGLKDAIEDTNKFARARVLEFVLREGESIGTMGESRRINYEDGKFTEARIMKTGTDPKKFEGMLRAKGIEVTKYMVPDIKWKMPSDYDALKQIIDDGLLSEDEGQLLEYDKSYALQRSKEGKKE